MFIEQQYTIYYRDDIIGFYHVFTNGKTEFRPSVSEQELDEILSEAGLGSTKRIKSNLSKIIGDECRVKGLKKDIYEKGDLRIEREAKPTSERYSVYNRYAKKGAPDYDPDEHEAPHYEGPKTPEGMMEWTQWYAFVRMDDGTYQAQLDEAWCWGGSHYDGGTISVDIPEDWHNLPYEEFLKNVVTLAAASHYGFDAEYLLKKEGLREFFGFDEEN
ncbi:MAG: hypothetical protein IJM15_00940 [Erysipelotrichaceae bacterium]|nr:hypothetical protein [Erysipelotrichaceae bacterium]